MRSNDSDGGVFYVYFAVLLFFLFYVPWWISIPAGMIFLAMQGRYGDS